MRHLLRNLVRDLRDTSFMPVIPRHDDLYLVEFPKSGVTWLCFLMANANLAMTGSSRQVTFFNIHEIIPDIHVSRHLPTPPGDGVGFRIIKSHASFTPLYTRLFYLARDPRHVMASYYRFSCDLGWWEGSIADFVRDRELGIDAWVRHVEGWLDNVPPTASFTLLRYEDLLADTAGTLCNLYQHLGYSLSREQAEQSAARSNVEAMRAGEEIFNAGHPRLRGFSLVRKGAIQGARSEVPAEVRSHIQQKAGRVMRRLGYDG